MNCRRRPCTAVLALAVLAGLWAMPSGVALADTYSVTKTADTADGTCDSDCSLREAIIAANQHPGLDTVIVPAGTYVLTLVGVGEDDSATGDLDILDDLTVMGAGADTTRIDGNGTDRVFQIFSPAVVRVSGLAVQNGRVTDGSGGGISLGHGGTLTLESCTVSGNASVGSGGGGIDNIGTLMLANCTLSNNSAGDNGGGIRNVDTATLTNCTLSNNSAANAGGGIEIYSNTTATLTNSTLSGNSASDGGGIGNGGGTVTLTNTIVASSTTGGNCAGPTQSNGHNLDDDGTCNFTNAGDLSNVPAHLGALANNGGSTQTIALLSGSPAINAGDPAVCASPPVNGVDQRGRIRPGTGYTNCSIGAYEYNSSVLASPTTTPTQTATPTQTLTPSRTATFPPGAYRVTKTDDTADGTCDSDCSLREAIIAANQHPGPDTVIVPAGIYVLTLVGAGEDESATGDLDILDDLTIVGAGEGATWIGGNQTDRVFQIFSPAVVRLSGLTIQGGRVADGYGGGGIANSGTVMLTNCTLTGNSSGGILNVNSGTATLTNCTVSVNDGPGIYNEGTATLTNCTLSGNSASYGGGGIDNQGTATLTNCTLSGNSAAAIGGGIFNANTATLTNCTLSDNSAPNDGGGIYNSGMATLTNCTLDGNSASYGGGIGNQGTATLTNCTLNNNSASYGGGIGNFGGTVTLTLTNTIVASSPTGGDCAVGTNLTPVQSNGHNLADDGTCNLHSTGDLSNVPAHLGPLGDNGGPTQTIALLPDSPAINAGDPSVCASPPVNGLDQRGYVRPGTGYANCSIGAYEYDSAGPPGPTATPTPTATSPPTSLCVGNCDSDHGVTVDEILTLVSIALGAAQPLACPHGIPSAAQINVALIIQAVSNARNGCPLEPGATPSRTGTVPMTTTPSPPTLTRSPTRTATPTNTPAATHTVTGTPGAGTVSAYAPASLLVYPYVTVDSTHGVDTVVQLSNVSPHAVAVHCFYEYMTNLCADGVTVCKNVADCGGGACLPTWSVTDWTLSLLAEQPLSWRASQGSPAVPPPAVEQFTGLLRCVVVDNTGAPIATDALIGEATVMRYVAGSTLNVARYDALGAASAHPNNGDNTLVLGDEYASCPQTVILNHFFDGANDPVLTGDMITTTLAIVPCSVDYQQPQPAAVGVQFLFLNEFAQRLSYSTTVRAQYVTSLASILLQLNGGRPFSFGTFGQTRFRSLHGGLLAVAIEGHQRGAASETAGLNTYGEGVPAQSDMVVLP